jgi:hypothetical protein
MTIAQQIAARVETDHRRSGAIAFAQWAVALTLAKGRIKDAIAIFEQRWPRSIHLTVVQKAAVAAGGTSTWGSPLAELQPLASAFVQYLAPLTVVGRLQGMRVVPFGIKIPRATAGTAVSWVGQGRVKAAFARVGQSQQLVRDHDDARDLRDLELFRHHRPPPSR